MSFWTAENIKAVLGGAWLSRGNPPAELDGLSTDSRAVRCGQVFLALRGEKTDGHKYLAQAAAAGAGLLIVDDAASAAAVTGGPAVLQVTDTGAALLKLAGAYRRTLERTKVIAVGGSNGKTTTVKLIHQVLGTRLRGTASIKSFNNAVGVPLTILGAKRTDQYLVCEVGTNAPGEIAPLTACVEPDIAVLTSIGREHLEGLGSLSGVVQEEASLLAGLRSGGVAVLNADAPGLLETAGPIIGALGGKAEDPRLRVGLVGGAGRSIITFGWHDGADLRLTSCDQSFEGLRFCLNDRTCYDLPLLGAHNATNATAAIAVARRLGLDNTAIAEGLAKAKGPEMRLERSVAAGVSVINDAYNANPDSVLAALDTFRQVARSGGYKRTVLVLGDMLELGEQGPELHREVGEAAAAVAADLVVLVGRLSLFTGERLSKAQPGVALATFPDLNDGRAAEAAALLQPGDLVLLKASRGMGLERVLKALQEPPARPLPKIDGDLFTPAGART
ncbi:MAG TPA: UDP-N-acetylmuramoyl-tripeptide--D-alanyl-D-alanine ligase [Phycisphaerales bacterium]|nr:UDP-N-acetylmuramoyl-tripeptide--D-alanyl-D-alanine ligase [Phycisphaerales bacterium]